MHFKSEAPKTFWREVIEWAVTLGIAVLAALIVQRYIFTLARVVGPSMQDTLKNDQIMVVLRIHYRFTEPERGDVVFCRYPDFVEDCVKRVIGLPGDTVSMSAGVVYINGQPLDEPYLTRRGTQDFAPVTVEEGRYFVMGDNRENSLDSRDVGALSRAAVEGECLAVVWPFSAWGAIR